MACALWGASGRSPLRGRSALVSAQKNSGERRDELYGFDVLPFNMYWNYCYSKFAKRYFRRTSMLAPSRMAGRLLSSMPPYTEVLCVASTGLHRVGLARSDPYLSKATTMAPARPTALGLRRALYSGAQIGLVIVALPLRGRQSVQQLVLRSRRLLGRALSRAGFTRPQCRMMAWDRRLTLDAAQREQRRNELWQIDGLMHSRTIRPSTHAAVALQDLLDEEMGGWPNTFG